MCKYCHDDTPGGSGHDTGGSPAEVSGFNPLWTRRTRRRPAIRHSGYTAGDGTGGSCASVMCHNNQDTPATLEWYDGNSSACTMCHTAGGTDDIPNDNIHPNSGLHAITPTVSETPHDGTLVVGAPTVTACRRSDPATSHINVRRSPTVRPTPTADSGRLPGGGDGILCQHRRSERCRSRRLSRRTR